MPYPCRNIYFNQDLEQVFYYLDKCILNILFSTNNRILIACRAGFNDLEKDIFQGDDLKIPL